MRRNIFAVLVLFFLAACAGLDRSCASCTADNFGADWIVVQLDLNGKPFRCWEIRKTSISNEPQSDGIYWKDPAGNLVHISGLYNRVQVMNGQWEKGFASLGLTKEQCKAIHDGV